MRGAAVGNADSAAGLAKLLPWIEEGPALFWLDAHLPQRYAGSPDVATFPLEAELRLICGQRDTSGDVFLMDDLRIYEDGPFRAGPYTLDIPRPAGGAGFVTELLGATHEVTKSYLDEGYIVALPSRAKRYQ